MAEQKTHKITAAIARNLPQELIIDILLRVPVKLLGRLKLVCKTWNCLISSQNFAKSHLQLSCTRDPASVLFVLRDKGSSFILNLNVKDLCNFKVRDSTPLPMESGRVLGSSHGLICFKGTSNRLIRVFNPTTKECRYIPYPSGVDDSGGYCMFGAGFGFFPSMDEYKIVSLAISSSLSSLMGFQRRQQRIHIISSKDDRWRELDSSSSGLDASVDQFPSLVRSKADQVVLWNEAFFWVVPVSSPSPPGFAVLKFDVTKETFSTVPNPKHNNGMNCSVTIGITQHNNLCVCQILGLCTISALEMWTLDTEYGDWKILFKLRLQPQYLQPAKLLGFTFNGYVFINFWDSQEAKVMILDTNQERPTYHLLTQEIVHYPRDFVASLISPYYDRQDNP